MLARTRGHEAKIAGRVVEAPENLNTHVEAHVTRTGVANPWAWPSRVREKPGLLLWQDFRPHYTLVDWKTRVGPVLLGLILNCFFVDFPFSFASRNWLLERFYSLPEPDFESPPLWKLSILPTFYTYI